MPNVPVQVLVVESDPRVAREVTALALEAFPSDLTIVLATTTSVADARVLIDRLAAEAEGSLLVVCAASLRDGESGLDVLELARRRHPRSLGVVITNGEREEFVEALRLGPQGIVARPVAVESLRPILRYLGDEARVRSVVPVAPGPLGASRKAEDAQEALERALDAVETAHHALKLAMGPAHASARAALDEAERLAVKAHRRVLDAQRALREPEAFASAE